MNIQVWPFLVSRNRYFDYRTIVAPDFICELKISNLLARVAEGELTEQRHGFIRQVIGSKAGEFTIAFRVIKATAKDINDTENDNILKDQFGREIYIFEGIVVRGIQENLDVNESTLQDIHHKLMTDYQKFWDSNSSIPATSSQSFIFDLENVSSPIILGKLEPFTILRKPQKAVPEVTKVNNFDSSFLADRWGLFLISFLMIVTYSFFLFVWHH